MKDLLGWILTIAVIWYVGSAISGMGKYEGETAEYWYNEYDRASEYSDQVINLKDALGEANSNIEDANSNIDNAKMYQGAEYDEMEYALSSLETVDTVSDPTE